MFRSARDLLERAVAARAFPCAVAEVGNATGVTWREAVGAVTYEPGARRADTATVFDLASLTKVLATSLSAMQAVDRGLLGLGDPASKHLPVLAVGHLATASIEDLLAHTAGLPAWLPLYRGIRGVDPAIDQIRHEPLAYRPGSTSVYSDLGFIVLGRLLEVVRGRRLDLQFEDVAQSLGLADSIGFRPARVRGVTFAPTELDLAWRGRLLEGEVHDENAWALGGVAGHSGLFGTAEAVGVLARHLLQVLGGRSGLVSTATARRFTTRRPGIPGSSRALGWDTMLPTSSCGRLMSPTAVGHTGFTGTSLWVDPERGRYAVLLTNRVHPTRHNDGIQGVRMAFHETVWVS